MPAPTYLPDCAAPPKMRATKTAAWEGFMITDIGIRRRTFLGGAAALGAMHGLRMDAQAAVSPSVAQLPARRHVVIRDAYVMTMEPGEADLPKGDVHVDNGL
ncbi:MAG: hypothetical protein V7608_3203, partial [Hyphomicrobiales bacterium]